MVETEIGKPRKSQKITDNAAKTFDEEREYLVAPIPQPNLLIVRYLQGRAVQFLWQVSPEIGSTEARSFVEQFGFKVGDMKIENYPMVVNWTGISEGIEYEKISAMKSGDVYNNLTVIVKKK